jgi:hypothetical protein
LALSDLKDPSDDVPGVDLVLYDLGDGGPENGASILGFAAAGAGFSRIRGSESIQDNLDDEAALERRLADPFSSLELCEGYLSGLSGLWLSASGCSLISSLCRRNTPLLAGPFKNDPVNLPTRLTRSELCMPGSSPWRDLNTEGPRRGANSSSMRDGFSSPERSNSLWSPDNSFSVAL